MVLHPAILADGGEGVTGVASWRHDRLGAWRGSETGSCWMAGYRDRRSDDRSSRAVCRRPEDCRSVRLRVAQHR